MEAQMQQLVERLEKAVARLEKVGTGHPPAQDEEIENPFDDFAKEKLDPITPLAETLPDAVKQMTEAFVEAHRNAGKIVAMSLRCAKPTAEELQKIHEPIKKCVDKIDKLMGYKRDPQFNHGQCLKEAARTASWVLAPRAPHEYVDNTFQVGEYYGLIVVRENKGKNDAHVKWFQGIKQYILGLQEWLGDYYRNGLTWKDGGIPVAEYKEGGAAPAPAAAPAAPAAPAPAAAAPAAVPKPTGVNLSAALFGELNQGSGITGRLRKVTDDQKTKNRPREERVFTVPEEVGVKKTTPAPAAKTIAKPPPKPVFENRANRLNCDNQVNNQDLKFHSESIQQSISMYNCKNCTLVITGKVNQVHVDKCVKCKIMVDNVISVFEIINSRDIDMQVVNLCSSVQVESSESIRIYVSEEGMKSIEVFSAKSSNISVYAPGVRVDPDTKEETEDLIEHPLPSTLRSVFNNGQLAHDFVKHG